MNLPPVSDSIFSDKLLNGYSIDIMFNIVNSFCMYLDDFFDTIFFIGLISSFVSINLSKVPLFWLSSFIKFNF